MPSRSVPPATHGTIEPIREVPGLADVGIAWGVEARDHLYLTGQLALGTDGLLVGHEDCGAQTAQCFHNIDRVLAAMGANKTQIAKITCYLTAATDFPAYAAAKEDYLAGHQVASTAVVIKELMIPGALIEVDVVAVTATPRHSTMTAGQHTIEV